MKSKYILPVFLLFGLICFSQNNITIETKPAKIYIENGDNKQIINFDFLISNQSADTLYLDKIEILVFDSEDNLLHSRFLDNNGTAPSIMMMPQRIWNSKTSLLLFNPFSEFQIITPIHRLKYEFTFTTSSDTEFVETSTVLPTKYSPERRLAFPLKGRILVYDAHDYTSHHRRFDYNFAPIKEFGISSNFMRYAYDFVILDADNKQFKNKGETNQDYFGFEMEVFAVADGKVIYASNEHKDDNSFDMLKLKENPLELYGNCVAIEHADHSISIYGHLRENSIEVKLGESVQATQQIGSIGVSGSSFFPHLHFEVRTSIANGAEGLPSYFHNILLLEGKQKTKLISGLTETGNILETE